MEYSSNSNVKLLSSWPSPFSLRARIALNLKSVKYELIEENMNPKSKLLLESNPVYQRLPVLINGDNIVCESQVIVQYIDEVWCHSSLTILPHDPYDRAIARFWASYIDDKLYPEMRRIPSARNKVQKQEALQQTIEGLELLEETFKNCSKGKRFFGGDQIGFLDIVLGCFLAWFRVTEKTNDMKLLDEVRTPALSKWAEAFVSDSAVKICMPDIDKLVELSKLLEVKLQATS